VKKNLKYHRKEPLMQITVRNQAAHHLNQLWTGGTSFTRKAL
jgi:hypothetical protein